MAEDNDYGPFRRDAETTRRAREYLGNSRTNDDAEFVARVEREGINFANIMQGLDAKDAILKAYGVTRLTIAPGRTLPLSECTPERRNMVLKERYESAKRRVGR